MDRKLLARIERLEQSVVVSKPGTHRYGWLAKPPLPDDYRGERHYVVVSSRVIESWRDGTPRIEWCEFEERAGPAPEGDREPCGAVC